MGVNDYGIQRAWGVMHFGISEGNGGGGGLKYGSPSVIVWIFSGIAHFGLKSTRIVDFCNT